MTDRADEVAHDILGEAMTIARTSSSPTQVGVLCVLAAELRLLREAVERKIARIPEL